MSIYDRLIPQNVIVHRINIMLYLLIHMIHEKIIQVNDQENANVVEKNHKHVKDIVKMMDDNPVMENDNDYDGNLRNNHNDLTQYYLKRRKKSY